MFGLPQVSLNIIDLKLPYKLSVNADTVKTLNLEGPEVLLFDMAPYSPLINLTISGLDIDLQFNGTEVKFLGLFGV